MSRVNWSRWRLACTVVLLLQLLWLPGCTVRVTAASSGVSSSLGDSSLAVTDTTNLFGEPLSTAPTPPNNAKGSTLSAPSSAASSVASAASSMPVSANVAVTAEPPAVTSATSPPRQPSPNATSPTVSSSNSSGNSTTLPTVISPTSSGNNTTCLVNRTVELRVGETVLYTLPSFLSRQCDCQRSAVVHPSSARFTQAVVAENPIAPGSADGNAALTPSSQNQTASLGTPGSLLRACVELKCDNRSVFKPVDLGEGLAPPQNLVELGRPSDSSLNITWHATPVYKQDKSWGTLEKVYVIDVSETDEQGDPTCNFTVHACSEEGDGKSINITTTCDRNSAWNCSPLGSLCSEKCNGTETAVPHVTCSILVRGLKPLTNYSVKFSNAAVVDKITDDRVPSKVQDFTVEGRKNDEGIALRTVHMRWKQPAVLGVQMWYNLSWNESPSSKVGLNDSKELTLDVPLDLDNTYYITIQACTLSGCSDKTTHTHEHKPGKPKAIRVKPMDDRGEATAKTIRFNMTSPYQYFDAEAGKLDGFAVALGDKSDQRPSVDDNVPCSGKEHAGVGRACVLWNVKESGTRRINDVYAIGEGCDDCSLVNLKPDHEYCLFFIGYTSTNENASSWCFAIARTEPDRRGLVALVVILLIVLLVLLAAVLLLILRRRKVLRFRLPWEKGDRSARHCDLEMTRRRLTAMHVPLKEFNAHVQRMHENSNLEFSRQFKDIKQISPTHPFDTAVFPGNVAKNRYADVMPFDHSRVHLITNDDDVYDGADYINANYIPGFNSPREYIATQGPLPSTISDFWRMIWEQNVPTIVMLTSLIERGCTKCERYWPEPALLKKSANGTKGSNDDDPIDGARYEDIHVRPISYESFDSYDLTVLEIEMGTTKKRVNHFYYRLWPDMSCPHDSEVFVNFVEQVRQSHKPGRHAVGPMVVHCSAGVGRTGTFIAVDILLQRIRVQPYIDIPSEVLTLREHRCRMVQTEDQYVFIHDCIAEAVDLLEANSNMKANNGLAIPGGQGGDGKRSPNQRSPASKSPAVLSPASRSPAETSHTSRSPAPPPRALKCVGPEGNGNLPQPDPANIATSSASRWPGLPSPTSDVTSAGKVGRQPYSVTAAVRERATAKEEAAPADKCDDSGDSTDDDYDDDEDEENDNVSGTPAEEGPLLGGGGCSRAGGAGRGDGDSLEV